MSGRMHPHSTGSQALGLHSCRALSSGPHHHLTPKKKSFENVPLTNHIPAIRVKPSPVPFPLSDFRFCQPAPAKWSPHPVNPVHPVMSHISSFRCLRVLLLNGNPQPAPLLPRKSGGHPQLTLFVPFPDACFAIICVIRVSRPAFCHLISGH